jgi:hypothetical protein
MARWSPLIVPKAIGKRRSKLCGYRVKKKTWNRCLRGIAGWIVLLAVNGCMTREAPLASDVAAGIQAESGQMLTTNREVGESIEETIVGVVAKGMNERVAIIRYPASRSRVTYYLIGKRLAALEELVGVCVESVVVKIEHVDRFTAEATLLNFRRIDDTFCRD